MGSGSVGLFDLANPGFALVEGTLLATLPRLARLAVWALVASALSMALYRLLSPQGRIAEAGDRAKRLRRELQAYEGEPDGLLPLAGQVLGSSLRHFGLILGPAVLASLPVLFLLSWLSNAYGEALPAPGQTVTVQVAPDTAEAGWSSDSAVEAISGHAWKVVWPADGAALKLNDGNGVAALSLPLAHPVGVLHKRIWWNRLFANPNGYLPEGAAIELVTVGLPTQRFIGFGPNWMRGWELSFFALLVVFSLAIKFGFRIR